LLDVPATETAYESVLQHLSRFFLFGAGIMSYENDEHEAIKELLMSFFSESDFFPYSINRIIDKYNSKIEGGEIVTVNRRKLLGIKDGKAQFGKVETVDMTYDELMKENAANKKMIEDASKNLTESQRLALEKQVNWEAHGDKYKFKETRKLYNVALCNDDYQLAEKIAYLLDIYTFANEKLFAKKFKTLSNGKAVTIKLKRRSDGKVVTKKFKTLSDGKLFTKENKNFKYLGKGELPLSSQWLFEIKILQSIPEIKKKQRYVNPAKWILKHFNEKEILLEDYTKIYGDFNITYLKKVTNNLNKIYSRRLSKIEISKRKLKAYIDIYLRIADIYPEVVGKEPIDKDKLTNEVFILRELNIFSTLCHPEQAKRLKYLLAMIYDYELLVTNKGIKFDEAMTMLAKKYNVSESKINKDISQFRYDKRMPPISKMKKLLK